MTSTLRPPELITGVDLEINGPNTRTEYLIPTAPIRDRKKEWLNPNRRSANDSSTCGRRVRYTTHQQRGVWNSRHAGRSAVLRPRDGRHRKWRNNHGG
jgi:hypothetical protein